MLFHGSETTTNIPQTKVNCDHTTLHWQKSECMIKIVTQSYSSRDQAGRMKIRLYTSRCTPCISCQEGRLPTKRKEYALLNCPTNDATATSKAKETPTNGLANHWEAPPGCREGLPDLQLWLLEDLGLGLQRWWKHLRRQWMTSTNDNINATLTNLDVYLD